MTTRHQTDLAPHGLRRLIAAWRARSARIAAAREKRLAIARLAETSEHLLRDIGLDPHGCRLPSRGLDSPTVISDRAPTITDKTSCRTNPCGGALPSAT